MAIAGFSPLAAQALVINTEAQASANGVASPVESDIATSGRIRSSNSAFDGGSNASSSASGNDSGFVVARASGGGTYDALGEVRLTETVINSAFVPFTYDFNFRIDSGSLRGGVSSSAFTLQPGDFVRAAYEIEILVNGVTAWESAAAITFDENGTSFVSSGVDLGTYTPGSDSYRWDSFTGSLDLGVLDPGEVIDIEYLMRATAEGNVGVYSFGGGECGYGGGDDVAAARVSEEEECLTPIANSSARTGDPFGPAGTPLTTITSAPVGQVPTPVPLGLIATSLLALGWQRRRRANSRH